jgi:hypothetical protein
MPPKQPPAAPILTPSTGTNINKNVVNHRSTDLVQAYEPVLRDAALKAELASRQLASSADLLRRAKVDEKIAEMQHEEFMFGWKAALLDEMGLDVDKGTLFGSITCHCFRTPNVNFCYIHTIHRL